MVGLWLTQLQVLVLMVRLESKIKKCMICLVYDAIHLSVPVTVLVLYI
jgi:hypothetical protein